MSEGQENDCTHAIELLSNIKFEDALVIADKGYDSDEIIDFIYENGGDPTIPSRANRKAQRHCDWSLYKERHLVECFFAKLKNFRRIATRYDKLSATFIGFVCIASIAIWLK